MEEVAAANVSLKTTSSKFEDSFWGKDNGGYSLLVNNLKGSVVIANTLADYIKELMGLEKSYIKGLQKLSKYLQQVPDLQLGSYYPIWLVLMKMVDGVGVSHEQHVASLGELMTQVAQYSNKQDEKMKANMKGDIAGAHKSLAAYTKSRTTVGKSRKSYRHSCAELVEAKCEVERAKLEGVGKGKEMDKLETKVRKATAHMESALKDHHTAVQHQSDQLTDFKEKMTIACQRFESLEKEHIDHMLTFTGKLLEASVLCASKQSTEYDKAREKFDQLPSSKLLQMFAQIRGTGRRRPEPYTVTVINIDDEVARNIHARPESPASKSKGGLFKSKKKKSASPAPSAQPPAAGGDVSAAAEESSPAVDKDGFSIRPEDADKITWSDEEEKNSDSDSEWEEDETEKKLKGLHIKEKPVVGGSTIDDLSKAVGGLTLGGGTIRSATSSSSLQSLGLSTTPTLQRSNRSSSSISAAADPQASLLDIVLQPTPLLAPSSSDQSANLSLSPLPPPLLPFIDVSASLPDTPPIQRSLVTQETPPLQRPLVAQETPPLQRPLVVQETPPLQRPLVAQETPPLQRPLVAQETPPLQRPLVAESAPSLLPPPPAAATRRRGPSESPPPGSHVGTSVVSPISPLVLSQHTATSDNAIPIAVAFQETCNAIFKGSDNSKAVIKVTGEVIFSFPAMYLAELSHHKPLQFSLSNHQKLSRILHNQHLMEKKDNLYVFMMDKLCVQLKQMKDKHSLPFYNIQVLKYEVLLSNGGELPLQLSCIWKCDPLSTTYTLHYSCVAPPNLSAPLPLKNVSVVVAVGSTVTSVISQPEGVWSKEQGKISWKIGDLSVSADQQSMSLNAEFKLSTGPSSSSPTIVQFLCDSCTLSGSSLQLIGQGYKISLHKNKLISGRYMAEPAQHLNQ